jgi:hypothetical protein
MAELGFYIGIARKDRHGSDREDKQAGSILAAILVLFAFLLALVFNFASNIHSERKGLVTEEANAIATLFLRTELFESEQAREIRNILREYTSLRVYLATNKISAETFFEGIVKSEDMHMEIWDRVLEISSQSDRPL